MRRSSLCQCISSSGRRLSCKLHLVLWRRIWLVWIWRYIVYSCFSFVVYKDSDSVHDAISRSLAFGCRQLYICVFRPTVRRSDIFIVPTRIFQREEALLQTSSCSHNTDMVGVNSFSRCILYVYMSFDRLWGDPAYTLCQRVYSKVRRLSCKHHLVLWRGIHLFDGILCTLAFCLWCTRTLALYTTSYLVVWLLTDLSSIVVAFHYNLQIPRNTLVPVCLPFAFAFQLAQHHSALQSCRAIVFEKEGSCVMQNSKRKCQASYQASVWWVVLLSCRCMWNVLKLRIHGVGRGRAYIWVCSCVVWWQATRRARSFFWFFCALWCVEVLVSSASCWRTCIEWLSIDNLCTYMRRMLFIA